MYTEISVEASENCPMSAHQVFKNLSEPVRLSMLRLYEGGPEPALYHVTGWSSSGSPCDAFAVRVEDSGSGSAFLVYGGDWGIRLRPAGSGGGWDLTDPSQWGETHLILADAEDLIAAEV